VTAVVFGLRLGRWGVAGFGLAGFAVVFAQAVGFYQLAGSTLAQRIEFGAQMAALAAQLTALFAPPVRPDTVGGYVEFRGFHLLEILFAVWALASVAGFVRGDEDRGIVDASLATGIPRPALAASRAAAFALAAFAASFSAGLGVIAGVATAHDSVALAGVAEECVQLGALAVACYGVALLAAQVLGPRLAPAGAAALLLALFLVNSLGRVFSSLSTWRWLSPFRYYELGHPLVTGGVFDWRPVAALVAIGTAMVAAAALLFTRRDVRAGLVNPPARPHRVTHEPAGLVWRVPVLRELYEQRAGLLAWALGISAVAAVFVAVTRTIVQVLLNIPSLLPVLTSIVHEQVYPVVLGYTWFNVAQLLLAGYAIAQAARWAAEDGDGRLELFLSQPWSRASVVVERMLSLAAGVLVIVAVSGAVLLYGSHAAGIDLDVRRLVAASLMLVPFALVFAGAGALLAAWSPRAAVALLGAFAVASYLDTELAVIYRLPSWLQDLSAFRLYGTPLLSGVDGRNLALLVCLALAGLGGSILAMQRRDVAA
jgi:polyether ionophore transport system permease protein